MKWVCLLIASVGFSLFAASHLPAFQILHPQSSVPVVARADSAHLDGAPVPPPLLRVDSALVLIPVTVTSQIGAPVTGLTQDSFRVFEDRVEQKISAFYTEDAPVSVGFLLDASGSMRIKWHKTIEAASAFFQTSGPQDEFFLVEFNDRAKLVLPFTFNADEVCAQIARSRPSGRTSLVDAIYLAVAQMKHARYPRKALVIVSDGGDNWSRHSVREMKRALVESDVQVYAMGIFDYDYEHNHPVEERDGPEFLDEVTSMTGGQDFVVGSVEELPSISQRLGRELRSQYLLGYYPTDSAHDGKYRQVQVKLAIPDGQNFHTTYRHGYYRPSDQPQDPGRNRDLTEPPPQ
ncbi:MAG TPA: VWA domain-containing protein [Bryobacteraceae bacterium]|nr:VWA domain-containing protein [Bryobacteraceae bacterium]